MRGADVLLIRRAIAEGWRVSPEARGRVLADLVAAASSADCRVSIGAAKLLNWIAKNTTGGSFH